MAVNATTVSIAMATYEMRGAGARFMLQNLSLIAAQTYRNLEVVVSDHSSDDEIRQICDSFSDKLAIRYFRNGRDKGCSSCNFNNALAQCRGDLIKVLMQDDYLCDPASIEKIVRTFEDSNVKWLLNGSCHGTHVETPVGSMIPNYDDRLVVRGLNTIGGPSVLTFRKECVQPFDETLIWMMDCDYYKRLFDKYGPPTILAESLVFITRHKDQISSWLDETTKRTEEQRLRERYGVMKDISNSGERMDIDYHHLDYNSLDMYQKSHFRRYEWAATLMEGGDVVADMACGSGYGSMMLLEQCREVCGYDLDGQVIEEVRKRYKHSAASFHVRNLLEINDEQKFDKIVSFETLEHFTPNEIARLIPRLHRALKPGGKLIFSTPYNQVENHLSRVFHRTFYITEDDIEKMFEGYFQVTQFRYQDYASHTIQDSMAHKDFLIGVAEKLPTGTVPHKTLPVDLTIDELSHKYQTDKRTCKHGYTIYYERLFRELRRQTVTLLEIGGNQYASLRVWRDYFPNGRILGLAKTPVHLTNQGITTLLGDQCDPDIVTRLQSAAPEGFDIIIDDGDHLPTRQRTAFELLFPLLNPGGWYVIEDLQTAYLSEFTAPGRESILDFVESKVKNLHDFGNSRYAAHVRNAELDEILMFRGLVFLRKAINAPRT